MCFIFDSLCVFQEMILDKVEGKDVPRFLVYDIVKFEVQCLYLMSPSFGTLPGNGSTWTPVEWSAMKSAVCFLNVREQCVCTYLFVVGKQMRTQNCTLLWVN